MTQHNEELPPTPVAVEPVSDTTMELSAARPRKGGALRAMPWIGILYTEIAGNLTIALSPLLWAGFSEHLHLSDQRIGDIISGEFFGAAAATVAGVFYMHRRRLDLRYLTYVSVAVYAAGNFLTPHLFASERGLLAIRVLCGLSSGTVYLAAAAAITGLGNPPRLVALFYGAPFISGAVLQPVMHTVFERWGFGRAFVLMAAATALSLTLYPFFPRYADNRAEDRADARTSVGSLARLGILSTALLLQYIANSGIWLFFARIGELSGHAAQTTANIVGVGTGMALAGTWLSALLVRKLRPVDGILWGTAIITLSSLTLHFASNLAVYAGSVAVFNAMITFVTPFYVLLMVRTYSPVQAVVVGNICMTVGFSLGPFLIGHTVHDADFARSIDVTVGLFATSALLVLPFRRHPREAQLR
jgi:MFS family permease